MSRIRNFISSPTRARNPSEFSDTRRPPPPQPWVVRYSERANPGIPYYFNTRTFKSQWEFPEDDPPPPIRQLLSQPDAASLLSQWEFPKDDPPPPDAACLLNNECGLVSPETYENVRRHGFANPAIYGRQQQRCNGFVCEAVIDQQQPNSLLSQPPNPLLSQPPNSLLSQPPNSLLRDEYTLTLGRGFDEMIRRHRLANPEKYGRPKLCNGIVCEATFYDPLSMERVIERLSSEPPGAILSEIRAISTIGFSKNEIDNLNSITRFLSYLEAFDKTKHIMEQKFPNLDQYIIDDAFKDAIFAFTNNPPLSQEDAYAEFFKVMMNSINERKIQGTIQPGTLTNLMLLRERSYKTEPPLTSSKAQDFTSAFMKLPSRPLEMIAEKLAEQANKFKPQYFRFPRLPEVELAKKVEDRIPVYIRDEPNRLKKYFDLNDKLREQLIFIERTVTTYPFHYRNGIPAGHSELSYNEKENVQLEIFEEFYRLTKLNLNANELERLIIESVIRIIRNSPMSREQMRNFMSSFSLTINNQNNKRYCNKLAEEFK
jgi:hypothetical protein